MILSEQDIELIKIGASFSTPIIVLIIGLIISKKLEKNKLAVLKEKEWQVKWAELFLKQATDFNDNISALVCLLFNAQNETDQSKLDELPKNLVLYGNRLREIEWNIQNYAQFSTTYQDDVLSTQKKLMVSIGQLITKRQGDLEEIRKQQFAYNKAVRQAHSEILNMK